MRYRNLEIAMATLDAYGVRYALIHESALALWEVDINLFLQTVDVLVDEADVKSALGVKAEDWVKGEYVETDLMGVRMRLWRTFLGKPLARHALYHYASGCACTPSPRAILAGLAETPDANMLLEQRAHLAEVVYADCLSDEALAEFQKYVRLPV